jgi:hypothetical protein
LSELTAEELAEEALERYRRAAELERLAAAEWERAGQPLLVTHANRITSVHPLLKAVMSARRDAAARLEALGRRRHRGPEPSAVPGIRKPRSTQLRAVD